MEKKHHKHLSENRVAVDNYGLLLLSISLSIIVSAVEEKALWARLISTGLLAVTLLLSLWISNVKSHVFSLIATVLIVSVVFLGFEGIFVGQFSWFANIFSFFFIVLAGVVIGRRVTSYEKINLQTVLGALCIYLLLGFSFANIYSIVDVFNEAPVVLPDSENHASNFLYFSFITMTTVGFGDIVPYAGLPRAIAVTEALTGQLYLVTIVALLVGNLGRERLRPRRKHHEENEPT